MTMTNEDRSGPRAEVWEALDDVMSSVPAQADLLPKVVERVRPQAAELVRGQTAERASRVPRGMR